MPDLVFPVFQVARDKTIRFENPELPILVGIATSVSEVNEIIKASLDLPAEYKRSNELILERQSGEKWLLIRWRDTANLKGEFDIAFLYPSNPVPLDQAMCLEIPDIRELLCW